MRERWRRSRRLGESHRLVLLAVGVGLGCGLGAAGLIWLLQTMRSLFFGAALAGFSHSWVILIPALGGLAVGPIIAVFAPETKGHGVPEVMLAVARMGGRIRARVAVFKALASAITIGSGGSAGREGPIVQIGSAMGSALGQRFGEPPEIIRMLVACGAAAGIAASFNTPIAGVLFALEVILRDFAARAFAMVVAASVTASVVSWSLLGRESFFHVPPYHMVRHWELLLYLALGVISAIAARIFIRVLYATEDGFERIPIPEWLKPAIGGLAVGAIGFYLPQVFGTGHDAIEDALAGHLELRLLGALLLAKLAATSLTLGSGGSGGVFAPSLFMGAMLGGSFAFLINHFFNTQLQPGAFAVVGMGAVFSGATFAPISAILIIFEMTHDYGLMLPLMTACVISVLVSHQLSPSTIYTLKLRRRGIELRGPEADPLSTIHVADVMTRDVETLPQRMSLGELVNRTADSPHSGFPVVDDEERLVGLVTYSEMREALASRDIPPEMIIAYDLMRPAPPVIRSSQTLAEAAEQMRHHGLDRLPVVSEEDSDRIVGILTQHDLLGALRSEPLGSDD
jgi:CIC family chloride channel protein